MLLKCDVGDSWESLALQGDPTSPSWRNESWIFIGRSDAEAEAPIPWPPDGKNQLIGKDPDAGKDWRREEKGMTEDEMVGWHHWLNGHEFEYALGVGIGKGSLACCSAWGHRESDTTEWLNWMIFYSICCNYFSVLLVNFQSVNYVMYLFTGELETKDLGWLLVKFCSCWLECPQHWSWSQVSFKWNNSSGLLSWQ